MMPAHRLPVTEARAGKGLNRPCRQGTLAQILADCDVAGQKEYLPEKRSFRIVGHSTTVCLELAYWRLLEAIAGAEGVSVTTLVGTIYAHCEVANSRNMASCLRVLCLRYLSADEGFRATILPLRAEPRPTITRDAAKF